MRSHLPVVVGLALLGGSLAVAARAGQQPLDAATAPAAAERQRVERLSRRAAERVRALRAEADELASHERTVLEEIRRLEIDRQSKTEELAAIDSDLADTTGRLEEAAARMAALEREVDAQRPLVEARSGSALQDGNAEVCAPPPRRR